MTHIGRALIMLFAVASIASAQTGFCPVPHFPIGPTGCTGTHEFEQNDLSMPLPTTLDIRQQAINLRDSQASMKEAYGASEDVLAKCLSGAAVDAHCPELFFKFAAAAKKFCHLNDCRKPKNKK